MDESNEEQEEKKKPTALSASQIVLVLLVIAVAVEIMTIISDIIWYRRYAPYTYDYDIEYLSDDEVKAAGNACTQMGHFEIPAESVMDDIYAVFEEEGLDVTDEDTSSFNQIYGDGSSWYETDTTFTLAVPGDETGYQRLTLNYDTATGALHEIDLFISDEDQVLDLTAAFIAMLNERMHIFDASSEEKAMDELAGAIGRHENMDASYGADGTGSGITLTLYCFEDGYSVYIGREQI